MSTLIHIASFVMSLASADSVRVTLVAPADVRAGAAVALTLRVENLSAEPIDLYLRGRTPTFDVLVSRDDGTVVWQRLKGEIIPAVVQLRALAPREVLELKATWDQRDNDGARVSPGRYTLRGQLLVEGPPPLESAAVQIVIR